MSKLERERDTREKPHRPNSDSSSQRSLPKHTHIHIHTHTETHPERLVELVGIDGLLSPGPATPATPMHVLKVSKGIAPKEHVSAECESLSSIGTSVRPTTTWVAGIGKACCSYSSSLPVVSVESGSSQRTRESEERGSTQLWRVGFLRACVRE